LVHRLFGLIVGEQLCVIAAASVSSRSQRQLRWALQDWEALIADREGDEGGDTTATGNAAPGDPLLMIRA
jgi:hypothetical protein